MDIEKWVKLAPLTTIKIGGKAELLGKPTSKEELIKLITLSKEKDKPILILGNGSNTILGDVKGVVIDMSKLRGVEVSSTGGTFYLKAFAGTPLKEVIGIALRNNLQGIYKLLGFPASVGGAVAMNAGAFGVEIKDFLWEVEYITWEGELVSCKASELHLSYRSSPFPELGVVVSCTFKLSLSDKPVSEEYAKIRKKRKASQPINLPTSGSTFKNPYPQHAGMLIEKVGMKGYRTGDVAFSEKHANFLVNLGEGSFEEVKRIIGEAKRRVHEEFGVNLEEEVKLIEDSGLDGWKVL